MVYLLVLLGLFLATFIFVATGIDPITEVSPELVSEFDKQSSRNHE